MKKLNGEQLKLAQNASRLADEIKGKKVYIYAKSNGEYIKKFIEIFTDAKEVGYIDDLSGIDGVCVVPANFLDDYATYLFEKKMISDNMACFLKKVRYSEHEWVLDVGNLRTVVLENTLCTAMFCKLKKKTAEETQISFHIVDHCNLNCQMCNKYSPLAEKHFVDTECILSDVALLSKLTSKTLKRINITGGEPTMHPDLERIIITMHLFFPNTPIYLMTNGICLKEKDDSFFELLKNNSTVIWLTRYPINFDYDSLIARIKQSGLQMRLSVEEIKTSWRFPLDLEGKQKKYWMFFCWMHEGGCINCVEGKIYPCGLMQASKAFERYYHCQLKRDMKDCIKLSEIDSFEAISEFMTNYHPFCANCKVSEWEIDIPWTISRKDIHEWI